MKQIDILILEDDIKTAEMLKYKLGQKDNIGDIKCAVSEAEALEHLGAASFDIMILDLIMSHCDGFHCMEQLARMHMEAMPDIIVISALNHEHAIRKSFDLGAKYYMIKPCDADIMHARIMDLQDMKTASATDDGAQAFRGKAVTVEHRIMEILLALGMPPHLKGYQYLREAIRMVINDPSMIYSITRKLYPAIAEKFDATPTKVELAIRHTIEVAWQRSKMKNARQIFGCDLFSQGSRPTNGELIALIADKIGIELQNE
ncbi:MAG: sporulation transcription factor Spo0A [Christensenellaceae bacterium]|jgi:two-component system response regulator (stage 0 sporulation protein A)